MIRGAQGRLLSLRGAALSLFVLFFAASCWLHIRPGPNQYARLNVLHAVFTHGTLRIDAYHKNTSDKAAWEGHFYGSKPPGMLVIAAPAFGFAALLLRVAGIPLDSPAGWLISDWIATAGSVGILGAAGGTALFLLLAGLLPRRRDAFLGAVFGIFGTILFPYGTTLFAHAASAGLLTIALAFTIGDPLKKKCPAWQLAAAGFAAGFAASSEYAAMIPAAAIGLYAVVRYGWRPAVLYSLGMVPPLLVIPLYGWLVFGTPFTLGYAHEFNFPLVVREGVLGLTFPPRAERLFLLLFRPGKGLFFWSPYLLLSVPGYVWLARKNRQLFWLLLGVPVTFVFLMAMHRASDGGGAMGPRHLSSIIPFIAIAAAAGFSRARRLSVLLGIVSVSQISLMAVYGIELSGSPESSRAISFGSLLGLSPRLSLDLLFFVLIMAISLLYLALPRGAVSAAPRRRPRTRSSSRSAD